MKKHNTMPKDLLEKFDKELMEEVLMMYDGAEGELYVPKGEYDNFVRKIKSHIEAAYRAGLVEGAEGGIGIPAYEKGLKNANQSNLERLIELIPKEKEFPHDDGLEKPTMYTLSFSLEYTNGTWNAGYSGSDDWAMLESGSTPTEAVENLIKAINK